MNVAVMLISVFVCCRTHGRRLALDRDSFPFPDSLTLQYFYQINRLIVNL